MKSVNAESVNDRVKLVMHRLIARQLKSDPDVVTRVREHLTQAGDNVPDYVVEWKSILHNDVTTVRRKLTERSPEMNRLRLSSPFVGVLPLTDPELRRRIYRKARLGMCQPVQA